MPKAIMGRASMFRNKVGGLRVQGIITKDGGRRFEQKRRALARLYREVVGRKPVTVSDADVIEYLARGDDGTRDYLAIWSRFDEAVEDDLRKVMG